jgi:hypothetical protein
LSTLAQRRIAPGIVAALACGQLGQRDAELLGEHLHRVLEADLLVQLEELEHVAAAPQPKQWKNPFSG